MTAPNENDRAALAREWKRLEQEREQLLQDRRRLEAMWDGLATLGVFMKDYEQGYDRANNYWREWGFTEEEMRGDNWMEKLHPADRAHVEEELAAIARSQDDTYFLEYRIFTAAGEARDVVTKGVILRRQEDGTPTSLVAMDIDVTALREAQRRASAAHAEAQTRADEAETLRTIGAVIASSLDVEHATRLVLEQIRHVIPYERASVQFLRTPHAVEIMGLQHATLEALDTTLIRETAPIDENAPQLQVVQNGKPLRVSDLEEEFPDYYAVQPRPSHSWLGVPVAGKGEIIGLLVIEVSARDFFSNRHLRLAMNLVDYVAVALQNARAYSEMQEQAATDPLTGLRTRRWFFDHAEKLFSQATRYGTDLSILISDVDHFKRVNDDHGHLTGDRALRALASLFLQEMRTADAVCRYGGEEFAVLLPHTSLQDAVAIAERLRRRASEVTVEGTNWKLSISVGVTSLREATGLDAEGLEQHDTDPSMGLNRLIAEADEALYRAKHGGRDRVVTTSM